ncbi:MAG TPA: MscL family protein [Candidatus Limnocylindria bacterium]
MIQGFKVFVMRGNVVDLAVALVLGLASPPWSTRSSRTSSRHCSA